jgi:hypothetical protein
MAEDILSLAQQAAAELGVPWTFVYGQWAHETAIGGVPFTSPVATTYHNLAGIKDYNNMSEYQAYGSLQEFKDAYVRLLKKYEGVPGAPNLETFVGNLKAGGYFGDTLENYYTGVLSAIQKTAGGIDIPNIPNAVGSLYTQGKAAITESTTGVVERTATRAGYILSGIALFAAGIFAILKTTGVK